MKKKENGFVAMYVCLCQVKGQKNNELLLLLLYMMMGSNGKLPIDCK